MDMTWTKNMLELARSLFEGPEIVEPIAQVPDSSIRVEDVPGNTVNGKYIGWADYRTGKIKIPRFDGVVKYARGATRQMYEQVRQAVRAYILGHEINELRYQPQTERNHGRIEADNLARAEAHDPKAFIAGLALHKARLEGGNRKGREFTKNTGYFYDLGKKFRQYAEHLDEWVNLVRDVINGEPTYLNGRFAPAYATVRGKRYADPRGID